jgi:hypothetical protein
LEAKWVWFFEYEMNGSSSVWWHFCLEENSILGPKQTERKFMFLETNTKVRPENSKEISTLN